MSIEKFFAILKDGEWHDIADVSNRIDVQTDKFTDFIDFLSKKGLIVYEKRSCRIKIKPEWQDTISE